MRRGWREVLAILAVSVMGTLAPSALGVGLRDGEEAPQRVALTVELSWAVPAAPEKKPALEPPAQDVLLEFSDGRVLEAVAWPWDAEPSRRGDGGPSPTDAGAWRLGSEPTGRVRLRIEAGLDSTLVVRRGEQEVRSPISAVLDRTQTVAQDSGLSLTLERVAWDVLAIDFGAGAEGASPSPARRSR
ncbi:hypothetical protein [Planctomyces sp. SH-PL62]|uniref:hypothetical protein n=1 Tax=Planctomyces sp. SH-PL62 TaxID=1636152 RepID=UPI00078EEFEA|nr:hypothetical protein [Planctomyces sp. SH-PL62]AMV39328.1 hypothetical protein VT85_17965 [Planctomyces sp. SH-PL62]